MAMHRPDLPAVLRKVAALFQAPTGQIIILCRQRLRARRRLPSLHRNRRLQARQDRPPPPLLQLLKQLLQLVC
jgi:hypothetical protein